MNSYAIYGGSFDPPHVCHKKIVATFLNTFDVKKLFIVPTYVSPFKNGFSAPPELRYAWVKKIFSEYENVEVLDLEIKKQKSVYTVDTVKEIKHYLGKQEYDKIFLIMGLDNARDFKKWHAYEELRSMIEPVVVDRGGDRIDGFEFIEFHCPFSSSSFRLSPSSDMICEEIREEVMSFYKGKI